MKNELLAETSPYLLQHAHNPVHWQPWGEAALVLAKQMDKPILISIGYSACHWCHVMERESFEIDATASIMNENFINIKIDREERPDIDHIYMDAVQAMTGSGGWPLNVFLTPDAKPFYGGTYFPPVKAFNRASWTDVLLSIADAWKNRRREMEQQAETLIEHLKKANNFGQIKSALKIETDKIGFTKEDCITITNNLLATADVVQGGFGKAPKFPQTFSINCLLQSAYFLKDEKALAHAERCLTQMLNGGIYDQLGGGLCRYSTDEEWLAPHFEKMLYDNALFITALSNAYLLTKKVVYKNAIEHVCNFLFAEMKNNDGGYYAAIDADSEGVEGKFYVWDKKETEKILGENAYLFNNYFDVTEYGNWEEKNILRILKPLKDVAKSLNITLPEAEKNISAAKQKLLIERDKRIRPSTDDKILLGWNALLIIAFCKAYAALQQDKYKIAAIELFDFIEKKFDDGKEGFFHTYKNGVAKYPAFLDDYTYLADACIQLQEITADENYLHKAKKITEYIFKNFEDKESGFFFFTSAFQNDIVVRKIEMYDGATPSANAVMAKNLLYLSIVFDNNEWHQKALLMIESLKTIIVKHPGSFGIWAATAINIAAGINEIVIVGNDVIPALNETLLQYLPNKILQANFNKSNMPLFKNREILKELSIYLCLNFVCKKPVNTVKALLQEIQLQSF
ncbi:MAG: thioredoxin domain-containing protein [Ferruginibacter sp.]|nr:thioredoxin domain-containing protein [Ferruginibacter sp.]